MIIFRFIALILIVAALMVLGHDALTSLQAEEGIKMVAAGELWTLLEPGSYEAASSWIGSTGGEGAASAWSTVMGFPAFAVLGVLGVLLAIIFRSRDD